MERKYRTRKRKDGLQHVQRCMCKRCKGERVRSGGSDGQRDSARRAGVKKAGAIFAGQEEHYDGDTRIEVKTGVQTRPIGTAFDKHNRVRTRS